MKSAKLREMTPEELGQHLEEVDRDLFHLRIRRGSGQLEQPLRLRTLRRERARIKTIIHERTQS